MSARTDDLTCSNCATRLLHHRDGFGAEGDRRPARIAVRFSDSEQTFPARAVGSATDVDLAALQVENVLGDVPVVPGFNARPDTLNPGTPLALVGFPLGVV